MDRREFIATLAALSASACTPEASRSVVPPGEFVGASAQRGHSLKQSEFPAYSETRQHEVAILGGGIAGLSAAWRLQRSGFDGFALYELEDSVGGNARWGQTAVSRYPLGAHYLPLPSREARAVRLLLSDLGVLQSGLHDALPVYDETFLCHAPQERLYRNGAWQEGVIPSQGLNAQESAQTAAFVAHMAKFKQARGKDGRRAFAVPSAFSSSDPLFTRLDRISMLQWMREQGYSAEPLHWYVDYACRDDFGTRIHSTSAWAGIHYFACRDALAESAADVVLTAPEGNGWLVRRLAARLAAHLHTGALVVRIGQQDRQHAYADIYMAAEQRTVRVVARQLICAIPSFVLPHLWPEAPATVVDFARGLQHAPWLVANLSLSRLPSERRGAALAWDNVLYDSPGLGYVVATHQTIRTRPGPSIFTYYRAFADEPTQARRELLETPREVWAERILAELARVHLDIHALTERIDIARYGHAMARPLPGHIWNPARQAVQQAFGSIQLAHADLSGFSILEEANYHGVRSAERALAALGMKGVSIL